MTPILNFRLSAGYAPAARDGGHSGQVNPTCEAANAADQGGRDLRQPVESGPHRSRFHCHTIPHGNVQRMASVIHGTSSAGLLYLEGGSARGDAATLTRPVEYPPFRLSMF